MLLGLYQCPSPAGDLSAGLAMLDRALGEAAAAGVEMLVLPELFLPGYVAATKGAADPDLGDVAALVQRHGIALTIGHAKRGENRATAFAPDGSIFATYSKIQPFGPDEIATFTPGNEYVTFDYKDTRFGLLICYDVEFAPHVRALTERGAEVILVPTANMMPFVNVHQVTVPARALENGITIVYANYCGAEGHLTYTGLSGIFGPEGYALAAKGAGPGLITAETPGDWNERQIPHSTQIADYREIPT